MTQTVDAFAAIRAALSEVAPRAAGPELDRFAYSIAVLDVLHKAARPAALRRGTKGALNELEAIHRQIIRLAIKLESLSPDARLSLGADGLSEVNAAMHGLSDLNAEIGHAHRRLATGPEIMTRAHRSSDPVPIAIAKSVANAYETLTSNKATRSFDRESSETTSEFAALLSAIFVVLKIDASADYVAKTVLEERRKKST